MMLVTLKPSAEILKGYQIIRKLSELGNSNRILDCTGSGKPLDKSYSSKNNMLVLAVTAND